MKVHDTSQQDKKSMTFFLQKKTENFRPKTFTWICHGGQRGGVFFSQVLRRRRSGKTRRFRRVVVCDDGFNLTIRNP